MPAKIVLKVAQGSLQGKEFVFEARTTCIIGRSKDCNLVLPDDEDHKSVSRHHCLLDINPPQIRIRDLGSLNGTFVNGAKIGQREQGRSPEEAGRVASPEHDLVHGDRIKIGKTLFEVSASVPASPRQEKKACTRCGKDVSGEMEAMGSGEYVCSACRSAPLKILQDLLQKAAGGKKDLVSIEGYRIVKSLGKGGMGEVFLAVREMDGRQVAIKVMLPRVAADKQAVSLFLRECEISRHLTHPNVVRTFEAGCSQGTFFLTMDYCDGGGVDSLMLKQGGRLPVDDAVRITLQALDGLDYIHHADVSAMQLGHGGIKAAKGVVHRDLKPSNLFLSGSGQNPQVKIADVGLAKAFDLAGLSGQTATGQVMGTPVFMPRQQVINFKYANPEVDVWAMAACLYNMLTGRFPREFVPGKDVWLVVLQTDPVPILKRNPGIPGRLADVIDYALRDNPKIAVKTATRLKEEIRAAMGVI